MQRYHPKREGFRIVVTFDDPCTDDACPGKHVYVITRAEYTRINAYIEDIQGYTKPGTGEHRTPGDWIADALTPD